jgi:hypothetical protein
MISWESKIKLPSERHGGLRRSGRMSPPILNVYTVCGSIVNKLAALTSSTEPPVSIVWGLVGHTNGLDVLENRKICCPIQELNWRFSDIHFDVIPCALFRLLHDYLYAINRFVRGMYSASQIVMWHSVRIWLYSYHLCPWVCSVNLRKLLKYVYEVESLFRVFTTSPASFNDVQKFLSTL